MIVNTFNLTTTPSLLLGPVDADYEVTLNVFGYSDVYIGASSGISVGAGNGAFSLPNTSNLLVFKLKVGDSLYGLVASGGANVGMFAQPC